MFSLRVFQNKNNEQTNTHVALFDAQNTLKLTAESLAHVDWESCVFQVYPADAKTHAFYALPEKHTLYLYDGESCLLGQTSLRDEYIYFKPLQKAAYAFRLVMQRNL